MISHATMYKNVILRAHYSLVDNILSSSAIWQNIAITSILYGTHAIPVSSAVIQEIEIIQNQVGKALLGVPQSTANVVIQSELGWLTPIIYTVFNIMDVLGHLVSSPQELMDISVKQLHQEYKLATLTQIKEMVILKLLPIPQKWWVRQPHVENPCWSSMNMKFRIMNAGSWGTGTHTEQRILFAKTGGESFNVHYVFKAQTKKFICWLSVKWWLIIDNQSSSDVGYPSKIANPTCKSLVQMSYQQSEGFLHRKRKSAR